MSKFKIGDIVQVIASEEALFDYCIADKEFSTGTIHKVTSIEKRHNSTSYQLGDAYWYSEDMIKLAQESKENHSHYHKTITGFDGIKTAVDVYRVLDAFGVTVS